MISFTGRNISGEEEEKRTFYCLLCYLCVACKWMRGNFEFAVDTFAIVLDKWMRNGFPKWKMSHTEEFKMNSYCEFLHFTLKQGTKLYNVHECLLRPANAFVCGGNASTPMWGMGL